MRLIKKLTLTMLVLMILVTAIFPVSALASSKPYKASSSTSYTIPPGRKGATLTLTPDRGKRAQDYVKIDNPKKKKTDNWKAYATYTVKVDGKSYQVISNKVKISLDANTTYHVSISCGAPSAIHPDKYGFFNGYRKSGNEYWRKEPSIKVDVNNWATID